MNTKEEIEKIIKSKCNCVFIRTGKNQYIINRDKCERCSFLSEIHSLLYNKISVNPNKFES